MPRITYAEHQDAMECLRQNAFRSGVEQGRKEMRALLEGDIRKAKDEARLRLTEAMARIAESNAQITTSIQRMIDEGLTK